MSADGQSKMEGFRTQINTKIQTLLSEFADGKLNREQFHAIYEHYNNQLSLADQALMGGGAPGQASSTIAIRQAHMGKALGLVIYHNRSGVVLDTLGDFDIPTDYLKPTLNDISQLMADNELIDRRVQQIDPKRWLMFAAGRFTTIITLFHHEPSSQQSREIERLHHDFEIANEAFISGGAVEAFRLAYPFLVFVQQKLKRP